MADPQPLSAEVDGTRSHHRGEPVDGILLGMTTTTIKISKDLRDRLRAVAQHDGLTLAAEIEKLMDDRPSRPTPTIGGFRSGKPLTAEEIDAALAAGFAE
jgi:hypothetical protein